MVFPSKMTEERSGRRSRGPSPNKLITDDSSDSDDSDSDGGMRVGREFQAVIPLFSPDVKPEARAEAMLVWAPHPEMPPSQVDEYITVAKEKHGYNMEQSLGMLFWHKHHIERALTDLANFTPFPDEWSVEDKVLFEQAFSFHGKSFHRIRQMLPDKSIAQLVKYYYSWKKTRSRTSLMDRQARKIVAKDDGDDSESDSDYDNKDLPKGDSKSMMSSLLRPGPASKKLELHQRNKKHKKKPPRGIYLTQEDLLALATGPIGQGEALLKHLNTELVQLKRHVQNNKQLISMYKQKAHGSIEALRLQSVPQKIVPKWTSEELLIAVQGVRKYGKDFQAIADVLENKTESHIRNFFVNYRKRYNLDELLAHYELENGIVPEKRRKIENGSGEDTGESIEKMEDESYSDDNSESYKDTSIKAESTESKASTSRTASPLVTKSSSVNGHKTSSTHTPSKLKPHSQISSTKADSSNKATQDLRDSKS